MPRPRVFAAAASLALGAAALALGAAEAGAQSLVEDAQWRVERTAHRALARTRAASPDPAPFETDGCSGGLSAAWGTAAAAFPDFADAFGGLPPWEGCCIAHDRRYHDAGPDPAPEASYAARLDADLALEACVLEVGARTSAALAARHGVEEAQVRRAYAAIGRAMLYAVRLGGGPCSGLPWRWGYGYPQCAVGPEDLAGP